MKTFLKLSLLSLVLGIFTISCGDDDNNKTPAGPSSGAEITVDGSKYTLGTSTDVEIGNITTLAFLNADGSKSLSISVNDTVSAKTYALPTSGAVGGYPAISYTVSNVTYVPFSTSTFSLTFSDASYNTRYAGTFNGKLIDTRTSMDTITVSGTFNFSK